MPKNKIVVNANDYTKEELLAALKECLFQSMWNRGAPADYIREYMDENISQYLPKKAA